jgi:hypothetical protein
MRVSGCVYSVEYVKGLVNRIYGDNTVPQPDEDNDECNNCLLLKRNCDGGQSCCSCIDSP